MIDYQIQTNSRRCAETGRELRAGEKYYSVLLDEAGKFVRKDYSTEAWTGPPAGAFSFWAGRIPVGESRRQPRFDDEMLMECFQRLEGQTDPGRLNFRFVLALLLLRRKRLKLEPAPSGGDPDLLALRCPKTRTLYRVADPRLTDAEMEAVQEEVFEVLGWE
jgi:hypothetical protein